MEYEKEVALDKTKISSDGNSVMLCIREYVEFDGEKLYRNGGKLERNVFSKMSKVFADDGSYTEVENENFHTEVDEFTGVENFIKKYYNFQKGKE